MRLLMLVILIGCGPFVPNYEGEPECGGPNALHAIEGESCPESVDVACDCAERLTLECVGGVWSYFHWGCAAGFGVRTPDGGP